MLSNIQKNIIVRALRIRRESGESPRDVLMRYTKLSEEEKNELLRIVEENDN